MSAAKPSSKDLRKLMREACRDGWRLSGGGDRHFKLTKDGQCIVVASSSCNSAAVRELRARLRRAS
jgi:hypothetical protein